MRAKPPSGAGITGLGGITRTTAASRAKSTTGDVKADPTAVKRKREALGEVVVNNRSKNTVVKGKEKENTKESFDGVVLKTKPAATRPPLRTVGTKQIARAPASRVVGKEKEATVVPMKAAGKPVGDDYAMVVDPPVVPGLIKRGPLPTKVARQPSKQLYVRESRTKAQLQAEEDDIEDHRGMKRRRTSSEPPEQKQTTEEAFLTARINAELEAYANEIEADPENSPWDDLDADDVDDPLMVSEYVVDIFKYLRQVEVCNCCYPWHYDINLWHSSPRCLTLITWKARESLRGKCVGFSWTGSFRSMSASAFSLKPYFFASILLIVSSLFVLSLLRNFSWWA